MKKIEKWGTKSLETLAKEYIEKINPVKTEVIQNLEHISTKFNNYPKITSFINYLKDVEKIDNLFIAPTKEIDNILNQKISPFFRKIAYYDYYCVIKSINITEVLKNITVTNNNKPTQKQILIGFLQKNLKTILYKLLSNNLNDFLDKNPLNITTQDLKDFWGIEVTYGLKISVIAIPTYLGMNIMKYVKEILEAHIDKKSFQSVIEKIQLTILEKNENRKKILTTLKEFSSVPDKPKKYVFDYDGNQSEIKKIITDNQKTLLVCPYCNINYISVTKAEDSNTKYLFVLDHFYDKATHPYFALSFYNLVPCCHTCNSSFKGSKDFSIKTHIHPYVDDFDSIARFSLPLTKENLQQFLVPNSSIKVEDTDTEAQKEAKKLKIKIKSAKKASKEDFERAENNVKDFLLEERYELHQDYINEILIKAYAYPDDYLESIQKTFPKLFEGAGSTEQMKRLIWGNYTQPDDINRRPLAKLTQDIMDELGLHKILKTNNLDTTQREG